MDKREHTTKHMCSSNITRYGYAFKWTIGTYTETGSSKVTLLGKVAFLGGQAGQHNKKEAAPTQPCSLRLLDCMDKRGHTTNQSWSKVTLLGKVTFSDGQVENTTKQTARK